MSKPPKKFKRWFNLYGTYDLPYGTSTYGLEAIAYRAYRKGVKDQKAKENK